MKKTDFLFERIVSEVQKIKDLDTLKKELKKLAKEIQKEIQKIGSPVDLAKNQLKQLELQYSDLLKKISKAQKQFDKEVFNALGNIKKVRKDAKKTFHSYKKKAKTQKKKIKVAIKKKAKKKTAAVKKTSKKIAKKISKKINKKLNTTKKTSTRKKNSTRKKTSS